MGFTWQGNPPEQLLTEHFSIEMGFNPGLCEIIEQLVQGKRVLAIQRTGKLSTNSTDAKNTGSSGSFS